MSAPAITFDPVMYTFRGYREPGGFEAKRPYVLVGSLFLTDRRTARMYATHGDLDDATIGAIFRHLDGMGITQASVNRHGKDRYWPVARWKTLGGHGTPLDLHFEPAMLVGASEGGRIAVFLLEGGRARIFAGPDDFPDAELRCAVAGLAAWGVDTVTVCRYGVEQIWINREAPVRAENA